jgi:hypothetical protein
MIDTSRFRHPELTYGAEPATAFDGSRYLVVWTGPDYRTVNSNEAICAARISPTTGLLDTECLMVTAPGRWCRSPAVAFGLDAYLVVWAQSDSFGAEHIWGARVSRDGAVLDSAGFVISAAPVWQNYPAVGFNGTNFLVTWNDGRSGGEEDIYGARVTPDGVVLDPAGIGIMVEPCDECMSSVSSDGDNYLVVALDSFRIAGTRVSPGGVVLDTAAFAITDSGADYWQNVAFGDSNYLVVWVGCDPSSQQVRGVRVSPAGAVLDDTSRLLSRSTTGGMMSPTLAFDGDNYVVGWMEWSPGDTLTSFFVELIDPDGVVIDTAATQVARFSHYSGGCSRAIATGSAGTLVAWAATCGPISSGVFGARLDRSVHLLDTTSVQLSTGVNTQVTPAVASDGSNYLVVWGDDRHLGTSIYGARVNASGMTLDPQAIRMAATPVAQRNPAAAGNGSNYLVVWTEGELTSEQSDLRAVRVSANGVRLDSPPIAVSSAPEIQDQSAVAFGGGVYLAVWVDGRRSTPRYWYRDVYGARVTPDGVVLDPTGFVIYADSVGHASMASVAFNGTDFLVVWTAWGWGSPGCARVTPGGVLLDTAAIRISHDSLPGKVSAVASDANNWLVVWGDADSTGWGIDLRSARVSAGGALLDTQSILIKRELYCPGTRLGAAFDGSNYLVAWPDTTHNRNGDIWGAWVSPAGELIDSFAVAMRVESWEPVVAAVRGSGSQVLVAYPGWTGVMAGKRYAGTRIWGTVGPLGGVEEQGPRPKARSLTPSPTIVRGVLELPRKPGTVPAGLGTVPIFALLDISGRKVLGLHPGANDVSRLAPGVYFVAEQAAGGRQKAGVRKVVIQR